MRNISKKAKAALALAVSLWMAEGAFWAPGVASAEVTIESTTDAATQAQGTNPTLLYIPSVDGHDFKFYCLKTDTKMKIAGGECKGANFSAGYSKGGEASGYTLTVEKGTFDAATELAGGYSLQGTANNNSVYINNGEGGASVFGGRGQVGASGNTVDMTGGKFSFVRGAYTHDGDAEKNTVTIKGGTVDRVFGGASHADSATGNSVTVSGGTTIGTGDEEDGVYGGRVYGTGGRAGVAEKNTVTVSGGTIDGSVYGGSVYSDSNPVAAATGNIVTISKTDTAAPTITKEVYGGYSQYDEADKNVVTISGGAIGGTGDTNNVYGGYGYTGTSENKVTISGGTMSGQVYGGYVNKWVADTKTATGNIVTISGGTVNCSVTGGYVDSLDANATATGNKVTISNGTVKGDVNGGRAGSATGNTVTISGGTITHSVFGGMGGAEASGNTVTISGGTFSDKAYVYGGMGDVAKNNTVNILTRIAVKGLYGGSGMTASGGNTLNLAAKGVKVGADGLNSFQNLNFYLPTDMTKSDAMLTVSGLADVTDAKVGVLAQGKLTNLTQDDRVTLLHAETMNGTVSQTTEIDVPESIATVDTYAFNVTSDANNIYATITKSPDGGGGKDAEAQENTKSVAETKAATTTFVNAGADMLASQGFAQAANAVALEMAENAKNGATGGTSSGFTPFAAFGGSGMRSESGSYVDTRGFGINIGFAREIANSQGKLLFGPVVEYGGGSYDSYLEDANNTHGEGGAHYFGVGIMARQVNHDGFYYEGSVRGGRVTSDYEGTLGAGTAEDPAIHAKYDSSSNYWAAHLGVGKAFNIGNGNTLDGYLKYFYSHQAGDTATIHAAGMADEKGDFDAVDSNRIRIGARLTHKINEMNSLYGGLAYQYEFGGEARAHFNGNGVPSPSLKGSSGMLELGWQVKPGNGPMTLDLGVTGWAGKQRGGSVQLGATWSF